MDRFAYCVGLTATDSSIGLYKIIAARMAGGRSVGWDFRWGDSGRVEFCFSDEDKATTFCVAVELFPGKKPVCKWDIQN